MTLRSYGRATPLQMDMLALGGDIPSWAAPTPPADSDRMAEMKSARRMLKQHTGRDFGFDLAAWHRFLLNEPELSDEYTFDYAWKAVRDRIERLLDNPDRARLIQILEADDATR